jgi:hypothetical protein
VARFRNAFILYIRIQEALARDLPAPRGKYLSNIRRETEKLPFTNPVFISFDSTSSDFLLVSGIRRVDNSPVNMKSPNTPRLTEDIIIYPFS